MLTVGALRRAAQSLVGASKATSTSLPRSASSFTSRRSASSTSWITGGPPRTGGPPTMIATRRPGQPRSGKPSGTPGCPYGQSRSAAQQVVQRQAGHLVGSGQQVCGDRLEPAFVAGHGAEILQLLEPVGDIPRHAGAVTVDEVGGAECLGDGLRPAPLV